MGEGGGRERGEGNRFLGLFVGKWNGPRFVMVSYRKRVEEGLLRIDLRLLLLFKVKVGIMVSFGEVIVMML